MALYTLRVRPTYTQGDQYFSVEGTSPAKALAEILRKSDIPPTVVECQLTGGGMDQCWKTFDFSKPNIHMTEVLVELSRADAENDGPPKVPEPGKKLPPQIFGAYRIIFDGTPVWVAPVRASGPRSTLLLYLSEDTRDDLVRAIEGWDEEFKRWVSVYTFAKPLTVREAIDVLADTATEKRTAGMFNPNLFTASPTSVKTLEFRRPPKTYEAAIEELQRIHDLKTQDYGAHEDPYANLRATEALGIPAWVGVVLRMKDKMFRLEAEARRVIERSIIYGSGIDADMEFARQGIDTPKHLRVEYTDGQVNESTLDSILDLANYALIAVELYNEPV